MTEEMGIGHLQREPAAGYLMKIILRPALL
jgi:hypothetical protein